jgi:hypothetical protein
MCTWITEKIAVTGQGKGTSDWTALSTAVVFYDHPAHAPLERALVIDFLNEAAGPAARVALELSEESARELVRAIESALTAGDGHSEPPQVRASAGKSAAPARPPQDL